MSHLAIDRIAAATHRLAVAQAAIDAAKSDKTKVVAIGAFRDLRAWRDQLRAQIAQAEQEL